MAFLAADSFDCSNFVDTIIWIYVNKSENTYLQFTNSNNGVYKITTVKWISCYKSHDQFVP